MRIYLLITDNPSFEGCTCAKDLGLKKFRLFGLFISCIECFIECVYMYKYSLPTSEMLALKFIRNLHKDAESPQHQGPLSLLVVYFDCPDTFSMFKSCLILFGNSWVLLQDRHGDISCFVSSDLGLRGSCQMIRLGLGCVFAE